MSKRIDFISPDEFSKLLKANKDKDLEVAMILGFGSGLRISEIIGYERAFKQKKNKETGEIIKIPDDSKIPPLTKDKINLEKRQIRLDEAKGGKWRVAPTSPALKPKHLERLPIRIKRRTLQNKFYRLSEKVLNKKISFHILRHGFGNFCVNVLKLPMPMVQSYMGHSSISTTGLYTKANPEEAINKYWEAMGFDDK